MIYTFRNKNTGEIFELEMPLADREPLLENCPELEQMLTKINIGDPISLGILPKEVKDYNRNVIGRMRHGVHGNNLAGQSRFNHNINEV